MAQPYTGSPKPGGPGYVNRSLRCPNGADPAEPTLKSVAFDRLPVFTVAEPAVDLFVDRVRDRMDRAVTERGVHGAGMGAAKSVLEKYTRRVWLRWQAVRVAITCPANATIGLLMHHRCEAR